ncbi:MAG: efflux RND transporter periplasmic adaptor subunit [Proteobacteria bacterium]|nr:efflux RND transporter periplasmic adaptor subunit [Pseudomonadota bacterium]
MSRPNLRTAVFLIGGLLTITGVWLFATSPGAKLERQRQAALSGEAGTREASPVVAVDAIVARERDSRVLMDVSGRLQALHDVTVGAEVSGRVIEVAAVEHDPVAEGDLLVRLDPALPRAAVERTRAALSRAEAAERLAASEFERQRRLVEQGVASEADFDRAESEEQSSSARVAEARAELADARTRLAKTRITAPFAGVVSRLDLEPGAYLRPGDPVADLVDLSEIEIEVGVDDRQLIALRSGDPVKVSVDVYPGTWFEGHIHKLGRAPDAETRKYPVPVRLANPDEKLLPGMLGTVRFELGDASKTLRIPRRAILREFELDYVWVLVEDGAETGVAERRRVSTRPVAFRPDLVDIDAGLGAGERVAVSGLRELRDGLRVRVRTDVGALEPGP